MKSGLFILALCVVQAFGQPPVPTISTNRIAALAAWKATHTNPPPPELMTEMVLAWMPATNGYLIVDVCTNLPCRHWQRFTNLYPTWPSNMTVPTALEKAYFRVGIVGPDGEKPPTNVMTGTNAP